MVLMPYIVKILKIIKKDYNFEKYYWMVSPKSAFVLGLNASFSFYFQWGLGIKII